MWASTASGAILPDLAMWAGPAAHAIPGLVAMLASSSNSLLRVSLQPGLCALHGSFHLRPLPSSTRHTNICICTKLKARDQSRKPFQCRSNPQIVHIQYTQTSQNYFSQLLLQAVSMFLQTDGRRYAALLISIPCCSLGLDGKCCRNLIRY